MAKLPKVGGLSPKDESYAELMKGIAKRQEAAAQKQQDAAVVQQNAAEKIDEAATTINQSVENQSKLNETISEVMSGIEKSLGSISKATPSNEPPQNVQSPDNKRSGRRDTVFTEILQINKDILDATLLNRNVLQDILDAMNGDKRERIADRRNQARERQGTDRTSRGIGRGRMDSGALGNLVALAGGVLFGMLKGQITAIKRVSEFISNLIKATVKVAETFGSIVSRAARYIDDLLRTKFPDFFKSIDNVFATIKGFISQRVSNVTKGIEGLFTSIKNLTSEESAIGKIIKAVSKITGVIGTRFTKALEFITTSIEPLVDGLGKIGKSVSGAAGKILSIFAPITKTFTEGVGAISEMSGFTNKLFKPIGSIAKYFGSIAEAFGFISKIVGKIFAPIAIIMTAYDTFNAAMEGYDKEGIIGGIQGAITGLFNSLIFGPLDLIKDLSSWVLKQFGVENASKFLDSFSFQDLYKRFIDAIFHPIDTIVNGVQALFAALPEQLLKIVPDIGGLREKVAKMLGVKTPEQKAADAKSDPSGFGNMAAAGPAMPLSAETVVKEVPMDMGEGVVSTSYQAETQYKPLINPKNNAFNAASSSFSAMAAAGPPPIVNVNNNNVTNNNSTGGSNGTKIGGNIITSPPQSHIDRSMYGWYDLHSATP